MFLSEFTENKTIELFCFFIEYLKLSHLDQNAPDSVIIKSKKDLNGKLQKGLDDIKDNKVILKGINVRLLADSDIDDLKKCND